jgi:hypothetical protein
VRAIAAVSITLALLVNDGCSTQAEPTAGSPLPPQRGDTAPPGGELISELPLTDSEISDVRQQVERNWNLGSLAGSPELKDMVVETRIQLAADGTITKIDVLNDDPDNRTFQQLADGIRRALMISSPLNLHGRTYSSMRLLFHPGQVLE